MEQDNRPKPTRKDLLDSLTEHIKHIEAMPPNAMVTPITHYDYLSLLYFLQTSLVIQDSSL